MGMFSMGECREIREIDELRRPRSIMDNIDNSYEELRARNERRLASNAEARGRIVNRLMKEGVYDECCSVDISHNEVTIVMTRNGIARGSVTFHVAGAVWFVTSLESASKAQILIGAMICRYVQMENGDRWEAAATPLFTRIGAAADPIAEIDNIIAE